MAVHKEHVLTHVTKHHCTCFRVFNSCLRCPVTGLHVTAPFKLHDVSAISHHHFSSIESLQDALKSKTHVRSCLLYSLLHTNPGPHTETAQIDTSGQTGFCSMIENMSVISSSLGHRMTYLK